MRRTLWMTCFGMFLLVSSLTAQNWNATPLYGSFTLTSGFSPDPQGINVMAGGETDASTLRLTDPMSGPCRGYISASQPDVRLNYTAGGMPLRIYAVSTADTTLLVNLPNTTWRCNDDGSVSGYAGLHPVVHIADPPSGQYDIWIGTYSRGAPHAATLYVTEMGTNHPGIH